MIAYLHRRHSGGGEILDVKKWRVIGGYWTIREYFRDDKHVPYDKKGKKIAEAQGSVEDAIDKILKHIGA